MNHKYLIILSLDINKILTQRTHHLLYYLEKNKIEADCVYFMDSYDNVPTNFINKITGTIKGLFKIVKYDKLGSVKLIGVRVPPLAGKLKIIFQVWWVFTFSILTIQKYNKCIAQGPFAGNLAILYKKIKKIKKIIYEDVDNFPEFYSGLLKKIIYKSEANCLKNADLIVSTSRYLVELRKQNYSNKIIFIPNGVNYKLFYQAQNKIERDPTLIFIGAIEEWSGIDLSIRAISVIKDKIPKIKYYIIGDGKYLEKLKVLAEKLNLKNNVIFVGRIPQNELSRYLVKADLGCAPFRPINLMKYAFTLKIIEYMASGLPVIATKIGETKKVIEESGAGEAINYSVKEFALTVIKLLSNKNLYKKYRENGIKFAKNYDWQILFDNEFKEIDKL